MAGRETVMPIDMKTFIKNRQAFPPEELAKYAGQWVAWDPDGTRILASSSESEEAVYDLLKQAGHDLSECCISYVPGPDEVILGGLSLIVAPAQPDRTGPSPS